MKKNQNGPMKQSGNQSIQIQLYNNAHLTGVTLKAGGCSMPVLALMRHLSLVHADVLPAGVTELGKQVLKAGTAVGPAVPHDVALSAQLAVALHAAEMVHVPTGPLRLRALVRKYDL